MLGDTSSSTLITSPVTGLFGPKAIMGTTVKLNGFNYLLWAQSFRIFIGIQNKLAYLLDPPSATTVTTWETWLSGDYCVMT